MECEYFEKLNDQEFGDLIGETTYWLIILAPDQRNLGTCVVALKREETELSGLNPDEWADLSNTVQKLEHAVKKAFKATMFNWACLMNSSYLRYPPTPHLHWHFIPRYKSSFIFQGKTFEDPCFGMSTMYDRGRSFKLSEELKNKIKMEIIKYLEI